MADIFVSYTSSDRDWAFWIAKELQALGHTAHVDTLEIEAGNDIYAWMERRHDAADHVLCVYSDEYMMAPYAKLERDAALWRAVTRPGFVLSVVVKPCRLPTLTDHYLRCELFGLPEEAASERFRAFMEKPKAMTIPFPGEAFVVSNIPIGVPTHFFDGQDYLAAIERALSPCEGRATITALYGLPGVGKTTLAAAYAESNRRNYRVTWWIRAETAEGMRADLVGLGLRLDWVSSDDKEEPALGIVMQRLRNEGVGTLLIYDNAVAPEAVQPYLPRGGSARVIVTSNAHAWRSLAVPVEIRPWLKDVGADFLIARTGRAVEREAALALSDTLGGLPLMLEQAADYCEELHVPFREYTVRFAAEPRRFLDDARHAPAEYRNGLTVAKTFALAIEEAARRRPAAKPLIAHCALLAAEPIPLFLFSEGREKFGEPLASALAGDGLDEAIAALQAFALVSRESIPDERDGEIAIDCIRLHTLVRQVASVLYAGQVREEARYRLIEAIAAVYPNYIWRDPSTWPRTRRLDGLALPLVDERPVPVATVEKRAADLLMWGGQYRQYALAAYAEARPLFERALAIREKLFGHEHPETAASLNSLAGTLQSQGELPAARAIYERALEIREKMLGPKHTDTAMSLNNLADLLREQGELVAARPLYVRALAIWQEAHGPEHPETVTCLRNVARLLQDQGDLPEARTLYERVVAIREKLGPEQPATATSLENLASVLQAQGEFAAARPLYERALAIQRAALGPEHPRTMMCLSNLGGLLCDHGETAEAELLLRSVIAIGGKKPDVEHPRTHRYRYQYARLLLRTNRVAEALALGEAALATHSRINGASHPWTKDSAAVTANALDALGRREEASALRQRYKIEK